MRPSALLAALNVCLDEHRPAFIWGPPGVGKSDLVAQLAASQGRELRDVRLNLLDPTDIKGFPVPNLEAGFMHWLPADFLPPMEIDKEVTTGKGKTLKTEVQRVPNDTRGILFLDELNQAPPSVQAAAYQLLLGRRIGNYILPDGWEVLAAGNRESDRANAQRMPSALSLRLVHFDYDVNVDDWCEWAVGQGTERVPTELVGFIRFRKDLLHGFNPSERVSPNPRSWTFVGQLTNKKLDAVTELEMFKGIVGEGPAGEYRAFLQIYRELPTVEQIQSNPEGTPVATAPAVKFAVSAMLAASTTKENFPAFLKYMMRMEQEWTSMYVRDAQKRTKRVFCDTKEYTNFAVKFGHLLC